MKFAFFLLYFASASVAYAGGECFTADKVKAELSHKLGTIAGAIEDSTSIPVCASPVAELKALTDPYYELQCVPRSFLYEAILNMRWDEQENRYESPSFFQWECAASTACWIWLNYNCDKSLDLGEGNEG